MAEESTLKCGFCSTPVQPGAALPCLCEEVYCCRKCLVCAWFQGGHNDACPEREEVLARGGPQRLFCSPIAADLDNTVDERSRQHPYAVAVLGPDLGCVKAQPAPPDAKTPRPRAPLVKTKTPADLAASGFEDFEWLEELGRGNFAEVRHVRHKASGNHYACKIVSKNKIAEMPPGSRDKVSKALLAEVSLQHNLRHPNVCALYTYMELESHVLLVLDYCDRGSLMNLISKQRTRTPPHRGLRPTLARRLFREVVVAVQALHEIGIYHRDIKPENVLLVLDPQSQQLSCKLGDFGCSVGGTAYQGTFSCSRRRTIIGTPEYMAPEILDDGVEEYDHRVDVWGLGVLLYEMMVGFSPFGPLIGSDYNRRFLAIIAGSIARQLPALEDDQLWDLISCFLRRCPDDRITLEAALQHCWLADTHGEDEGDLEAEIACGGGQPPASSLPMTQTQLSDNPDVRLVGSSVRVLTSKHLNNSGGEKNPNPTSEETNVHHGGSVSSGIPDTRALLGSIGQKLGMDGEEDEMKVQDILQNLHISEQQALFGDLNLSFAQNPEHTFRDDPAYSLLKGLNISQFTPSPSLMMLKNATREAHSKPPPVGVSPPNENKSDTLQVEDSVTGEVLPHFGASAPEDKGGFIPARARPKGPLPRIPDLQRVPQSGLMLPPASSIFMTGQTHARVPVKRQPLKTVKPLAATRGKQIPEEKEMSEDSEMLPVFTHSMVDGPNVHAATPPLGR